MNASEFTFGIEIETTIPSGACDVGGYRSGLPVSGLPAGWVAKTDGSIRARRGRQGAEFVSPVLRGADGLRQIITVCERLSALGAKVNPSCGLHVHVGWERSDVQGLAHLLHDVSNFETALFATTGTKTRERCCWCRSVRRDFRELNFAARQARDLGYAAGDRYHLCNVSNLTGYGHGIETVEFRAFGGTLNAQKIIAYVRLCLALAERAKNQKRRQAWEPKPMAPTSSMRRKGEGYTQLGRLLYGIGWIKGRTDHVFGNLTGDGLPTIEQSKRELRRLALKYDAAS